MAEDNANLSINIGANATGVKAGSTAARGAVKGVKDEAALLEAAFRRLQSAIDPTFRSQEKYNKALQANRELLASGAISAREFAANNRLAAKALEEARTAAERSSAAFKKSKADEAATRLKDTADAKRAAQEVRAAESAAKKAAATDARAAAAEKRAALRTEREAVQQAAREAKAAARETSKAERDAARETSATIRAAKAEDKQAVRDAANAAKAAARDRAQADRTASKASREAAEATQRQARDTRALALVEQELRSAIDPAYASQQRYNATMAQATQLLMMNKLRTGEWTQIQRQAKQQMDVNVRSLGRFNSAYVQLGYQAQDVTASLASGINPMVILAQQGGQTAAALSTFGGTVGRVASFMAGPWGAAILGVVTLLGLLIPKLFEAKAASEAMAESQSRLASRLDETTGKMREQYNWLNRLEDAKDTADLRDKARQTADTTRKAAATAGRRSVMPTVAPGTSVIIPAAIRGRDADAVKKTFDDLEKGTIDASQALMQLQSVARRNSAAMRELNSTWRTSIFQVNRAEQAVSSNTLSLARQAVASGNASAAQRQMVETMREVTPATTAELDAQVRLTTATDQSTLAQARYDSGKARAEETRRRAIALTGDQTAANRAYQATMAPLQRGVYQAQEAEKAANAARSAGRREQRAEETAARRARAEELAFTIETYEYEKEAAVENYQEQVRIQNLKINALRDFHGERSNEVARANRELERMERQHNQELLQIQREQIQLQTEIANERLDQETQSKAAGIGMAEDSLGAAQDMGAISGRPAIEAKREILNQQYQLEVDYENRLYQLKLKSLQDQLALQNLLPSQRREINNQLEILNAQHERTMGGLAAENARDTNRVNIEVLKNMESKYRVVTDSVQQSFSQMFQSMWTHSGNFKQSLISMADQIIFKYVDMGLKLVADWVVNEAIKTSATLTGNTVRTTAAATGAAATTGIEASAATAQIAARAATSAAGAYSSTVIIPFIGPVAAPAAAALALAAVMGFGALISAKGGMGEVPSDQLAMVHKKEMILPAWIAEPMRKSFANPRGSASVVGGAAMAGADARSATHNRMGDVNFKYAPTVTGRGGDNLEDMLNREGRSFRKWARNQAKNNRLDIGSS